MNNQHGNTPKEGVRKQKRLNSKNEASPSENDEGESAKEREEPTRKKRRVMDFEGFYESLKSGVQRRVRENNEVFESPDLNALDMSDRQALLHALKQLDKNHQRKVLIDYIDLGDILHSLKLLYVIKCKECVEDDESDGLTCKRCIRSSDMDGYFNDVKHVVSYVNCHINFLINISKLNKLYGKFKYISCAVSKLQPHIGKLRVRMFCDKEFWV